MCLSIVLACENFRVYLLGKTFRLRTEHKALLWHLQQEAKAGGKLSRWIATLLEYPIEIEYLKGSENTIADILSRMHGHSLDPEEPTKSPEKSAQTEVKICPLEQENSQEAHHPRAGLAQSKADPPENRENQENSAQFWVSAQIEDPQIFELRKAVENR